MLVRARFGYPETRFLALRTMNFRNPRTLLAYGAVDWPAWGEAALRLPSGFSKQLLWNNWIAVVNAALRHMAAKHGNPVIDLEALAQQLPAAYLYRRGLARDSCVGGGLLWSVQACSLPCNDRCRGMTLYAKLDEGHEIRVISFRLRPACAR